MMIEFSCRYCDFSELYNEGINPPYVCPECEGKWYRLTFRKKPKRKVALCSYNATMVENERRSDAMGINVDQLPEFKERFPWMNFDSEGRCIIRNRAEKKRVMRARGFAEGGNC